MRWGSETPGDLASGTPDANPLPAAGGETRFDYSAHHSVYRYWMEAERQRKIDWKDETWD